MGYPSPLGGITRRLNKYTVIHSVKFKRANRFEFGNRTAIIQIPQTNKLIVWSSIPIGREFQELIEFVTKDESSQYELIAAIIPDVEHTLAAIDLKNQFPNIFLIGPSGIKDKPTLKLDYEFLDKEANEIISGSSILSSLTNLDFIFLNGHANRELVTFDKNTNTLFTADLLFNIPWNGLNDDQYPTIGQTKGLQGFITGVLNPNSYVGGIFLRKLFPLTKDNTKGLKALLELDFETVVVSHGNVIDKNGKAEFKKLFGSYL